MRLCAAWIRLPIVLALWMHNAPYAFAETPAGTPSAPSEAPAAPNEATAGASLAFARGNELAREEKWGEALGAFEASLALRPHALTLYNIGVCERVLGRATRARERFRAALARDATELPPSIREEVLGFIAEYTRTLPRVTVQLDPKDAGIAVDGRPLREHIEEGRLVLEAGVLAPGPGAVASAATFELELDPGTHVIAMSRRGYVDVVQTRTFAPGQRGTLNLVLSELPATLRIAASVVGAQVKLNDVDVGLTPIEISRPGGRYRMAVAHPGYVTHKNEIAVTAGGESNLRIALQEERIPLTKRWWFWAGAAGILAIGSTVTYFVTRPTPPPQPYNGGSAGWVVFP
jgi:PEGA domain